MLVIKEYRFRPHRGGLAEALKEQASFTSVEAVLRYVSFLYDKDLSCVRISPDVYCKIDKRIGWLDVYTVQIKNDSDEWCIIGFCSDECITTFGGVYEF